MIYKAILKFIYASGAGNTGRRSLQFDKRLEVNGRHKLTSKTSQIYGNFKSIWRAHFWLDLNEIYFKL